MANYCLCTLKYCVVVNCARHFFNGSGRFIGSQGSPSRISKYFQKTPLKAHRHHGAHWPCVTAKFWPMLILLDDSKFSIFKSFNFIMNNRLVFWLDIDPFSNSLAVSKNSLTCYKENVKFIGRGTWKFL